MKVIAQHLCMVLLAAALTACGGGGGGGAAAPSPAPVPQAPNAVPRATILASGDARSASTGVNVTLGGMVRLDAGTSADDDKDTLAFEWSLTARPTGSALSLISSSSQVIELKPDQLGAYTFQLKATDPKGASSTQQLVVTVDNRAPAAAFVVTPTFTPTPSTSATQAVTVGASILLDGSASTDADGDAVAVAYEITSKPASSAAQLTVTGQTARLIVDQLGVYKIRAKGTDGRGGSFESNYVFEANNQAPNPVLVATASAVTQDNGSAVVTTSVGYDVVVDAGTSTDADGDALQYAWSLQGKPAGSAVSLSATTGASVRLIPDVLGDYTVRATVTDPRGATGIRTVIVRANNRRPLANIATNATPQALASAPDLMVPPGTELTLRGDGSADADGDALSYAWTLETKPSGSTAALSSTSIANPRFVADAAGSYGLLLRVTDGAGAFSERRVTVNAGRHAPVAVIDKRQITTLIGGSITANANLSYDQDGDTLTYEWALDARPAGSAAVIGTTNTAQLQFTPDLAGTYAASVTVRDGQSSSIAYVSVLVLANAANTVTLDFVPDDARYSVGLDKMVLVATSPNTLRIVDPFTAAQRTVVLPAGVKSFNLSNDGRLAVVLHEGAVSLIDLATATLIRTSASSGSQTDAFVTNDGFIYMIGQTGGQWVDESVGVLDGRTGVPVVQSGSTGFGYFYGTQYGVMAERLGKTFLMSQGLSPSDISYFTFNRATNLVLQAGDSPYHGDYSMATPLFLNEDQTLLFTSAGTYFRTDTLRYAGALQGVSYGVLSMSHAGASEELLLLSPAAAGWGSPTTYATNYKRFTGALFLPDADLSFPQIAGAASYGLKVFHTGTGRHVMLVQTGTATAKGAGVRYHVVLR
jgi:hypothetical protein